MILAAAGAAIGEPLECSKVLSSGDTGNHLPLFVFSSENRSELTLVHLQTHDKPKRANFTNIQGEADSEAYPAQCDSDSYLPQMQV